MLEILQKELHGTWIVAKREFLSYFATPIATVFLVIFVALTGAFAFYFGNFFGRGQADLSTFFLYHPWIYLLLVPAIGMRLWAEERKSGTIELLMTLPISPWEAILGKFAAAWAFIGLALILTFPMWITVNVLGNPDNGVILASYIGSWLMAGAYLAIASCISSLTKNQVIAFIVAATVCFLLVMSGHEPVQYVFRAWAPEWLVAAIASLSFLSHFESITKGILDLPAIIFYVSLIVFALFINKIVVDQSKAA
ncbi:MAG TPA: ABC transporter permease subunit [Hyphomicrobiaceae bacterium]|nr:ABC transporter permease subunit [Hyphomicrobiaceae bacterium]